MYNLKNYWGTQRRSEILDLQNTLQQLKKNSVKNTEEKFCWHAENII